ncbi:cilia- and flagella-associated protein 47-like isoform X2 [Anneissia japonica]|uniref:cilia- and flagella-associated protein 47-like isoform X2 n=1 Tax=Anneissia japonica TaxID=1529436 RepID=UPI0014256B90|nr:cilia- and flagella-associated protein 47-like isoform X2 [Anneissia japonica]
MKMDGDVAGVRISPPVIEFFDADSDTVYTVNLTVQNISKFSKQIKFHGPDSKKFELKVKNPEKPVAPGLEVPGTISFTTDEPLDCQDRIILLVDEDVIEIPIFVYSPQPLLDADGEVDFGTVVCNGKVLMKQFSIFNHGTVSGTFKLHYNGDKPVKIIPTSGTIKPNSGQLIKVEFITKNTGAVNEELEVELANQDPSTLIIKANVVERCLELLSVDNEDLIDCIRFGCTYYGTDKMEAAYLYNNSPHAVSFVTVLQEDAEGMEVGNDLTKSTVRTLAASNQEKVRASTNPLTTLVTTFPNQGSLAAYEKIPVFFRFSPRYNTLRQGWKSTATPPPRQDFSLFMQFAMVGSSKGFSESQSEGLGSPEGAKLEVALTGTALPVLLTLNPLMHYDMGNCPVGEHVDTLCELRNESTILPVEFVFTKIAQFTIHPQFGKLRPGDVQDIIISFKPNQFGTFRCMQLMDVIGAMADTGANSHPTDVHREAIHTLHISLHGTSDAVSTEKKPKFNPGITPMVVGEVGQFVSVTMDEASSYKPRAAMLNAPKTGRLHATKSASAVLDSSALVAFPNDRARSVRPSYRKENYKTIFTKTDRHTYVDPDYAYDDDEMGEIQRHKNKYNQYLQECREKRKEKISSQEFKTLNTAKDIGLKPASGLRPSKLKVDDIKNIVKSPTPPNNGNRMLSSKWLTNKEMLSTSRPSSGGLNAVPMTPQEKMDCKTKLSPQHLYQVIIGPPVIDFGRVCLKSTSSRSLDIVNNLSQYIHILVEIDCNELRQTSPLSQVVPPNCKAALPLIFESNTKGAFQRNVKYTVNGHHKDHIVVRADVVPVALILPTELLEIKPTPGMPAEAGLRSVISLRNERNYPAEFTWQPILGERGTAFSIRPATGTVDAFKDLDCEVVFHPSFHAPEEGEFILQVHGGDELKLKCMADLGPTQVMFMERRILFGQVPLHLTTTQTAVLHNNSHNHAYFQVLDPNPVPGLMVSPVQGVIPVGGNTELKIYLTPGALMKFDTRLEVSIRGWKTIDLRMGGTVAPPSVNIDMPAFQFGGVYCGSELALPFRLINKVRTPAKAVFDLSRYRDFILKFDTDVMEETEDILSPGIYKVSLRREETINCQLIFRPTEVASYDFNINVTINQVDPPSPDPTPFPPTPAPSSKSIQHIITPRPMVVTIATPKRKITATALRQPLQLSHYHIDFSLPSGFKESGNVLGQTRGTMLVNNSDKELVWSLNLDNCGKATGDGIFRFLMPSGVPFISYKKGGGAVGGTLTPGETYGLGVMFCPVEAGEYKADVPLILNGNKDQPYQHLKIHGTLKSPRLTFDPIAIVLTPVPLATEVSANFTIQAAGFRQKNVIDVELPDIELEDGSTSSILAVSFPDGQTIQPCSVDEGHQEPFILKCRVTFCSPRPVSFSQPIKFLDDMGNSFSIVVTATADNCLLTAYHFIAKHRTDYQIVTEQGRSLKGRRTSSKESVNVGEAMILPVESPTRPSTRNSSSTSSRFGATSSTYDESTASVTESTYRSTPRDGAVNHATNGGSSYDPQSRLGLVSRSLGSAAFPDEDSEEGVFHHEVLMAIQRWITLHGWGGGPCPATVPDTMRSGISKNSVKDAVRDKTVQGSPATNNQKKKFAKTIFDMIAHLSGRPIPGIPIDHALPSDPAERVLQLHWMYSTLLTFLRSQGASVASIKPEYLFEPNDYQRYMKMQFNIQEKLESKSQVSPLQALQVDTTLDQVLFESVSKRAWTDLLLQSIKVLILSRVTPRSLKTHAAPGGQTLPSVNADPQSSNIYGVGERILLSWLNHYYEQQRHKIWVECNKESQYLVFHRPTGGVPPSRWVVNFDYDLLDGLVLAALLAAHVPFLVNTHLRDMYTHPATAEQCLHNALKVVNALKSIGVDYDIQAIDITDPNPISLLLLCIHLYQRLPQYVPKSSVDFLGSLHATVTRQVRLTNPSKKPLIYHAFIAGRDAQDFRIPNIKQITVAPKSNYDLMLEFTSRFLRPAEGVLVLVGRRLGSACGTTLVFNLRTSIDNIVPSATIKCESPCYELNKVEIEVVNPFNKSAEFRIVLVEANETFPSMDLKSKTSSLMNTKGEKTRPKKVRSKIDHGQRKERSPTPLTVEDMQTEMENKETDVNGLVSAFFCDKKLVKIDANSVTTVYIDFLPFNIGKRQCSVLFINEDVGEFLYSIEATALLPLPSCLPFTPTKHSVRISSAAAAGSGRGLYGGDDRVIYWRCDSNQTLNEELTIPLTNTAYEQALVIAAQQRMNSTEIKRRQKTGTLAAGTVTAAIAALGLSDRGVISDQSLTLLSNKKQEGKTFSVETSSRFFSAPSSVTMPSPLELKARSAQDVMRNGEITKRSPAGLVGSKGVILDEGSVRLPIKFVPKEAGHYPCQLVLRSPKDIRVYMLECTVSPEGSAAQIEFTAPVHQSITQDIPIINQTNFDWPLNACLEGVGFYGPPFILAKAKQTSYYPLMFRPSFESVIEGKLVLCNTEDGTEHYFKLKGEGQKPLALDHIIIECDVRSNVKRMIRIPNVTPNKLIYHAVSDLPIVSGPSTITVLPGKEEEYVISVSPWKRGVFKGVLSFVAGGTANLKDDNEDDVGSRGSKPSSGMKKASNSTSNTSSTSSTAHVCDARKGYRIWYSIEVQSSKPPPEKTISINCSAQSAAVMEVDIINPTAQDLTFDVLIEGEGLRGDAEIYLTAGQKKLYQLVFSPAVIGKTQGSLIFQNKVVGEFWYLLHLSAETPGPTILPHIECELGKWSRLFITLSNPTLETLELTPSCSNTNNFTIDLEPDAKIVMAPNSTVEVPLQFMPSSLGQSNHTAKVAFTCDQLGEWVFIASGTGLTPAPLETVSISSTLLSNTSLIIPFRNPTNETVFVDVVLSDNTDLLQNITEPLEQNQINPDSAFCLLLKHTTNIHLGPKATLDIPFTFAPDNMQLHKALCVVSIRRVDSSDWEYEIPVEPNHPYGRRYADKTECKSGLKQIRWIYPIHGIPESHPVIDKGAKISCQARSRIEEYLEVSLMGAVPSSATGYRSIRTRSTTPEDLCFDRSKTDGVVVGEGNKVTEEFSYNLMYNNEQDEANLKHCVSLTLVKKFRDKLTGIVNLVFSVVYAPFKVMSHDVQLCISVATGGVWRFPITFQSTEATVDDVFTIESAGLNRESSIGFRLTSQKKHPMMFTAYFLAESDQEFSVTPQTGELQALGTKGTLIQLTFIPKIYGKKYRAKLVVQTSEMQWTYDVIGTTPEYTPPSGHSQKPIAGPHNVPLKRGKQRNFVRDNLRLTTTAVSSPVKGAPVIVKVNKSDI